MEEFAYLQKGPAARPHVDASVAFSASHNVKPDLWSGKGIPYELHDDILPAGVSFRLK